MTGTTGAASSFGLLRKVISFFQTEVEAGFGSWTGAFGFGSCFSFGFRRNEISFFQTEVSAGFAS
jgi:hypothetical protein